MKPFKVILSGGGTGGHIFPAVAIANEIKKMCPDTDILFVGALGKMEMEKVPAAGYKIIGIPILGLQRRMTWQNLKLPFMLYKSLKLAKQIIADFKPDVVVGTGGYASAPLLRAAISKGIPSLVQEQNSFPGITNRILANRCNKICVAYEGMEEYFPKEKIILTGNPVRQDLKKVKALREEAVRHFNFSFNQKTVLVIGGSLGARTINEAIETGIEEFVQNKIQLIWQTGKNYNVEAKLESHKFHDTGIVVRDFITDMNMAYAAADIVVSRAGASSVSELCNLEMPCILVPSPNVAEDHQSKNAMALVNKQAAILVKDSEAKEHLVKKILELSQSEKMQKQLRENIKTLAFHDSANRIALEVMKLGGYA